MGCNVESLLFSKKEHTSFKTRKINEFLRQPLFGNPKYINENNMPWGLEPHSRWSTSAKNGILTIGDLWNL